MLSRSWSSGIEASVDQKESLNHVSDWICEEGELGPKRSIHRNTSCSSDSIDAASATTLAAWLHADNTICQGPYGVLQVDSASDVEVESKASSFSLDSGASPALPTSRSVQLRALPVDHATPSWPLFNNALALPTPPMPTGGCPKASGTQPLPPQSLAHSWPGQRQHVAAPAPPAPAYSKLRPCSDQRRPPTPQLPLHTSAKFLTLEDLRAPSPSAPQGSPSFDQHAAHLSPAALWRAMPPATHLTSDPVQSGDLWQ